jgi:hypothetical protein
MGHRRHGLALPNFRRETFFRLHILVRLSSTSDLAGISSGRNPNHSNIEKLVVDVSPDD